MNFAFVLPKDRNSAERVKNEFITLLVNDFPTLSVVGIDFPKGVEVKASASIVNATPNSVIVIDSDNQFDVDWFPNTKMAREYGVLPDVSMPEGWNALYAFLKRFEAFQENRMNADANRKAQKANMQRTFNQSQLGNITFKFVKKPVAKTTVEVFLKEYRPKTEKLYVNDLYARKGHTIYDIVRRANAIFA